MLAPPLSNSVIFTGNPRIKIRLLEGRRSLGQLKKDPGKLGRSTKMQMSELRKLHPQLKSSSFPVKPSTEFC